MRIKESCFLHGEFIGACPGCSRKQGIAEGVLRERARHLPVTEAAENLVIAIDSDVGFFDAVEALRKAVRRVSSELLDARNGQEAAK